MKGMFVVIGLVVCSRLFSQSQELQQLKLDLEKLVQFKLMLSEMKSGYQTLVNGYNAVRDKAQANFDLHRNYLDGLLAVNPQLKKDPAVQQIYQGQSQLVSDYKGVVSRLRVSGVFTAGEIDAYVTACSEIIDAANADAELLRALLTPGTFRMSDAERGEVMAKLTLSVQQQQAKLKDISDAYSKTMVLRLQQRRDLDVLKRFGNH